MSRAVRLIQVVIETVAHKRQQIASRYSKILTEWPVDRLRPQIQFQTILKKRVQAAPASTPNEQNTAQIQSTKSTRSSELQEVTALSSLLDKHYSRRVCTTLHTVGITRLICR